MNQDALELRSQIRDIPDFPKPGILFKDITPILSSSKHFALSTKAFCELLQPDPPTKIIGIDARGFIFGATVAQELGLGFIPVRKKGKLPWQTHSQSYALEYGQDEIEIHQDALAPGEKVAIIDDLLATGGTAAAALQLVKKLGATPVATCFLIELAFLGGRQLLLDAYDHPIHSLICYQD